MGVVARHALCAASEPEALAVMQLRAGWQLDAQTALVVCDPTSPNILQFRAGRDVNQLLSRPFFVELQSRYGNLYFVREEVRLRDTVSVFSWLRVLFQLLPIPK